MPQSGRTRAESLACAGPPGEVLSQTHGLNLNLLPLFTQEEAGAHRAAAADPSLSVPTLSREGIWTDPGLGLAVVGSGPLTR